MSVKSWLKDYFKETGDLGKKRLKKLVLSAPFWVITIALALIITGIVRYAVLTGNRADTRMAQIWSQGSETPYRHVVVYARGARREGPESPLSYLDQEVSLSRKDILTIRDSLQNVVDSQEKGKKDKGVDSEGRPKGWEDCFSSFLTAPVTEVLGDEAGRSPQSTDTQIVAIEGNYAAFHPFQYLSGGFLPEVPVDSDQIVLNDVLAWRFFNSYDVVGSRVSIFGHDFVVTGVVKENDSFIDKDCGSGEPRAYIYFTAMEKYAVLDSALQGEGSGDAEEPGATESDLQFGIGCYEVMLPEMVNNVSVTDVKNALPNFNNADPKLYVVSQTGRLNVFKVWDYMLPLGESQSLIEGYEFPLGERAITTTIVRLFIDIILVLAGTALLFIGIIIAVMRGKKFAENNIVNPPADKKKEETKEEQN
ncbi:MAG: ABC transporter permease [Clostridiales bacterium]|nr:ABC transporter permease [Clostridiales bacterium]